MSRSIIETVVAALPLAGFLLDVRGTVLFHNARCTELAELGARALVGRTAGELLPELSGTPELEAALGRFGSPREARVIVDGSNGAMIEVHLCPLDTGGEPLVLVLLQRVEDDASRARWLEQEIGRIKHELSNSLMGLIGNAELLLDHPDLTPHARNRAHTILIEGRRVGDGLTDLSKLRRG